MNIVTHTNRAVDPWNLRIEDIAAEDIAHALSLLCRFVGHSHWHYSVAQHCLNVQELLEEQGYSEEVQLLGLLHDAPEAYLNDIASPTKAHLPDYKDAENRAMRTIAKRFGATLHGQEEYEQAVKNADRILLVTEARDLLPPLTIEAYAPFKDVPRWRRRIRRKWFFPVLRTKWAYLDRLRALRIAVGQHYLQPGEPLPSERLAPL